MTPRRLFGLVAAALVVAALLLRRFEAVPAPAPLPNVEWRGWHDDGGQAATTARWN